MESGLIDLLSLILPFIFAFAAFAAAYFVPETVLKQSVFVEFAMILVRLITFDHPAISKYRSKIARTVFVATGIICLIYPSIRDYSKFFPARFSIEVFFDDEGLSRALNRFSAEDQKTLKIDSDWKTKRASYFSRLNSDLLNAKINFQFLTARAMTIGKGEGTIRAVKIGWVSQNYKITEATGTLLFETPSAGTIDVRSLKTGYDLIETDAAYVTQSGFTVFYPHSFVVHPEFRQYINLSPTNKTFHHILMAATSISVPLFELQQTVYLTAGEEGEGNIPIGYAILSPHN
jgi:hypothetical protein